MSGAGAFAAGGGGGAAFAGGATGGGGFGWASGWGAAAVSVAFASPPAVAAESPRLTAAFPDAAAVPLSIVVLAGALTTAAVDSDAVGDGSTFSTTTLTDDADAPPAAGGGEMDELVAIVKGAFGGPSGRGAVGCSRAAWDLSSENFAAGLPATVAVGSGRFPCPGSTGLSGIPSDKGIGRTASRRDTVDPERGGELSSSCLDW